MRSRGGTAPRSRLVSLINASHGSTRRSSASRPPTRSSGTHPTSRITSCHRWRTSRRRCASCMRSKPALIYSFLFFLSGATALIYELLWVRVRYHNSVRHDRRRRLHGWPRLGCLAAGPACRPLATPGGAVRLARDRDRRLRRPLAAGPWSRALALHRHRRRALAGRRSQRGAAVWACGAGVADSDNPDGWHAARLDARAHRRGPPIAKAVAGTLVRLEHARRHDRYGARRVFPD